ncbi:MAG: PDZ domain-containing protein [Oscillospiraceae bacterium]|nr:PDZ domain-containing protein [Oscillospiraceae bacterium]
MNWKKRILKMISYILVAALASAATLFVWGARQGSDKLTELQQVIDHYFVGEADMEYARDAAAAALVDGLGDQWSYYIPASEMSAHQEYKENSGVAIGISIAVREDNTGIDILGVSMGGAADAAGILPGDILIKVDGKSVAGMDLDQVTSLVHGEEGAELTVTVLRNGEEMSFRLKRQKITVAAGKMLTDDIGLIRINNFNSGCEKETLAAIEQLQKQGAKKLIFDVRNNPGGYVSEMIDVLDHLLPEGVLFRQEDHLGNESEKKSDESCLKLPMAVLVNGDSYSAAEFFAAVLQEYEWASVVGEKTSGKGYYQLTINLSDGSAVNLSSGKYFTPEGVNLTEAGGLTPDNVVTVDAETAGKIAVGGVLPQNDPQIQAAIAQLQGK